MPIILALLALAAAPALSQTPPEEVPIERALFPARGFDDNDHVRILIEGVLPDACYVLGESRVSVDSARRRITIRQYAWRQDTGVCASGDQLPEADYSEEVSLGRLPAGAYSVEYRAAGGTGKTRELHVGVAKASTVDSFLYSRVTSIAVPDLVIEGSRVKFKVTGFLTSGCHSLPGTLAVTLVEDTLIVLPIETAKIPCPAPADPNEWDRAFERVVDVGVLPPGRYLIHVRSNAGKAEQRAFSVVRRPAG